MKEIISSALIILLIALVFYITIKKVKKEGMCSDCTGCPNKSNCHKSKP